MVQHRGLSLLSVVRQPGGEGVWERMDAWIRVAESLLCSPETTTTSLLSYTPGQRKKFKVKKKEAQFFSLPQSWALTLVRISPGFKNVDAWTPAPFT